MRFLSLALILISFAAPCFLRAQDAKTSADASAPASAGTVVPAAVAASPAATDVWTKQIITSLTLNQGSFTNWAQGGANFISWQAGFNGKLEENNPSIDWLNTLKMQYGLTYSDNQGTQITADTIDLESVFSVKVWPQVSPYASFSAQSQFGAGYNYSASPAAQNSDFMDPGYFTEGAGLKYTPGAVFNTRLGLAVKETVASVYENPYTLNPTTGQIQNVLTEVGLDSVSELSWKFANNSNWDSKLDMFWNGDALNYTVLEWDNTLALGVSKIISVNFENDYRYDYKVYQGVQIKETVGIGFAYSLL